MNIHVTEKATTELQLACTKENTPYVRIGVMPGGCSGFKYSLLIEDAPTEDDIIVEVSDTLKLLVDPFSGAYLEGLELDYVSTMEASGFKFNNPNATGGCGCGSSFSA